MQNNNNDIIHLIVQTSQKKSKTSNTPFFFLPMDCYHRMSEARKVPKAFVLLLHL